MLFEGKKQEALTIILLTIVTCGFYGLYYLAKVGEETNKALGREAVKPIMVWLGLITCGITSLIYQYQLSNVLEEVGQRHSVNWNKNNFWFWLLLSYLAGIGTYIALYQLAEFYNNVNNRISGTEQPNA